MNAYIAAKERSGMVPGGDMGVVAGDINVDRHGDGYRDMLGALSLTVPDASLGCPYSYDTHNNTIGEIRDGRSVRNVPGSAICSSPMLERKVVHRVGPGVRCRDRIGAPSCLTYRLFR
ncbi:hypothetical protein ACFRR7_26215 [Streptomyces sp. NPDC056909]|uniref:hypothetical protein n=1 Tax=Streptomyces sp. NPDC056909 TaxID=3345963 RepID=UPI0036868D8E